MCVVMASVYAILVAEGESVNASIYNLNGAISAIGSREHAAPEIVGYWDGRIASFIRDATDAANHVYGALQNYNWPGPGPAQYRALLTDTKYLNRYVSKLKTRRDTLAELVDAFPQLNTAIAQLVDLSEMHDPGPGAMVVEAKVCTVCAAPARKRSGACKSARYCSSACQAAHWEAGHREVCSTTLPV